MEFTEAQIRGMIESLRDDFPEEIATRELALLELEDLARKGCLLENEHDSCICCSAFGKGKCPMSDWHKRHPEYMNDELATKIRILEAGGEEAYREKQKRIEEAKKQAEAAKQALADAKKKIDAAVIKIRNETGDDKAWWKELDDAVEAYVQARINEKKGN